MTDGKVMYRERRWFNSAVDKRVWDDREKLGLPRHVAPCSTFVAAMGNHWRPGCREAVDAMCQKTWEAGYLVCLSEQHDRCHQPYDAIGVMRNLAYMRAIREGYEYILYVDNDARPEPDALLRLLARHVSIVTPLITYADGQDHGLTMPKMPRDRGLAVISSCVLSFVLFRTAVFVPFALTPFWQDALGADEDYHFKRLALAGLFPVVDTNVTVTCVEPPHFPLDRVIIERSVADLEATRHGGTDGGRRERPPGPTPDRDNDPGVPPPPPPPPPDRKPWKVGPS